MKYLRVKNWSKFQHPSPKPLPWIKLYTALLAPTKETAYSEMSDTAKALLHHIWLMARVFDNRIPETWITKEKLNLKSRIDLAPILECGLVWFEDENGLRLDLDQIESRFSLNHSRARVARSESLQSLGSISQENLFSQEFDALWGSYPRRIGRRDAERHFRASVKTPEDLAAIRTALTNYRAEVSDRDQRYISHGSKWFNQWRDWVDVVPAKAASLVLVQAQDEDAAPWNPPLDAHSGIWGQILAEIPPGDDVTQWLEPSAFAGETDGVIRVAVPSQRAVDEIRERFGAVLRSAMDGIRDGLKIHFVVGMDDRRTA